MLNAQQLEQLRLLDSATDKAVRAGLLTHEKGEEQKKARREAADGPPAIGRLPWAQLSASDRAALENLGVDEDMYARRLAVKAASAGIHPAVATAVTPPALAMQSGPNPDPLQSVSGLPDTGLQQYATQKGALAALPPTLPAQPLPRGGSILPTQAVPRAATNVSAAAAQALAQMSTVDRIVDVLTPAAESALVYILTQEGVSPAIAALVAESIPALIATARATLEGGDPQAAAMDLAETQAQAAEVAKFE
jgi:hypothetical protein